ncbi:MAG: hypothetical protein RLZZ367_417, partial [Bacteroidota bacterium]
MKKDTRPALRLASVTLLGLVLLNFPLLSLVSKPVLIAGVPVLFMYIFIVWALLLLIVRQTVNSIDDD